MCFLVLSFFLENIHILSYFLTSIGSNACIVVVGAGNVDYGCSYAFNSLRLALFVEEDIAFVLWMAQAAIGAATPSI